MVTVKSMPRSWAWALLPSSNATRAGSRTSLDSRSTSRWDSSSSSVANATASVGRPISTMVITVCNLFAASCACARSESVRTFNELSSPRVLCNSVRSRIVTTSEPEAPATGDRLTTSTRSSVTCTSSRTPGPAARRNSGRSDRAAAPGGSASRRRASSLASATRPRSSTSRPSDTECRTASWCSYITRNWSGRSPWVWRSRRRRISQVPASERARAARLIAAITGIWWRHCAVSVVSVMPAATRPTTRPAPSRTGAMVRTERPSVPV